MSMDALLNALGKDRRMIAYRPEWRPMLGSVNSVILLGQLLYWWKSNNGKPFYKFKAPCKHAKYREGDSWCEELGFSKAEFDKAWKQIEEAGFASKKINLERITVFTVDEKNLGKALMLIYGDESVDSGEKLGKSTNSTYESEDSESGISGNTTHVNQQSAFTLYKEHRLHPEITTEITPPTNLPPAEDSGSVAAALDGVIGFMQAGENAIAGRPDVVVKTEPEWPSMMTETERDAVLRLLDGVSSELANEVMAIWSWKVTQEKVNSRIGIFSFLCDQAKAGILDLSPAEKWREFQAESAAKEKAEVNVAKQEKLRALDAELRGAKQLVEASDAAEWAVKTLEGLQGQWQRITGSQWQLV